MFGDKALHDFILDNIQLNAEQFVEELLSALQKWIGPDEKLNDDLLSRKYPKSMEEIMAEIKERSEALKKLHEKLRKQLEDDLKNNKTNP